MVTKLGEACFRALTLSVWRGVSRRVGFRHSKKQQMRWNRWTLQPFLDVRVAVLNDTFHGSFKQIYSAFQVDNDNHRASIAA